METMKLPNSWIWSTLEEVTKNHDGKRVPVNNTNREKMKGPYPYYGASGIIDYVNDYLFEGNYLLIGEDGANLLSRSTPIAFPAKGKFWVNNHAHVLTTRGNIPLNFIENYINSIDLSKWVTGTAQPKLNQKRMNTIPIPLPPLEEQKRIVSKIEDLFKESKIARESLDMIPQIMKKFRQSVLVAAFSGNLVSQDVDDESAEKMLDRIREERRRKWEKELKAKGKNVEKIKYQEPEINKVDDAINLPNGWLWAKINLLCDIQTGPFGTQLHKSDYSNSGIPVIEIGDVHPNRDLSKGAAHFVIKNKALKLERYAVTTNDILFTRVGTVGRCTVVPSKCMGWLMSTSLIRVRIDSQYLLPQFLLYYFWSPIAQLFTKKTTKGTTRDGTNSKIVGNLPLMIPSLETQKKIVSKINELFSFADQIEESVEETKKRADKIDQAILAKAFRGELVPQDPKDEPASVLLERIKNEREKQLEVKQTVKRKSRR